MQPRHLMTNALATTGFDVPAYAERLGIGVIVYSPIGSGLLTGRMTREPIERRPRNDRRKQDARVHEPQLSRPLAPVGRLADVAAIVGFCRPNQANPILDASGLELTAAAVVRIEATAARRAA